MILLLVWSSLLRNSKEGFRKGNKNKQNENVFRITRKKTIKRIEQLYVTVVFKKKLQFIDAKRNEKCSCAQR